MRRDLLAICLAGLAVGCRPIAQYSGLPPSDVSSLKIGATRADVERQIGQPEGERQVCQGVERSYAFNRGMASDMSLAQAAFTEVGTIVLFYSIPFDLAARACFQACQRGLAQVTFDRNDVVVGYNLLPHTTTGCPSSFRDTSIRCSSIQNRGITPIVHEPPPDCEPREPVQSQ